jgi:predicted porin
MELKRTAIALAVGAAFAAPAAFADVTLSGSINAGPAIVKSGDGSVNATNSIAATGATAQQGLTRTGINTNYSNITIGSMEDLGGGLKLDFGYQFTANFQAVNSSPSNRNSHIGLTSDSWGGVWYGTNENLYERYYYTVDPLDGAAGVGGNLAVLGSPGYGSVFDAGNGGGADFYRRTDHTVWYDSPNWGGFTFGAYTTLTANKTANSNPRIWGFGGKWVGPSIPLQLWAAYEKHNDLNGLNVITGTAGGASSTKDHGIQVGVGYTVGDAFIFANWEQLKYDADGLAGATVNEYKRNAFSIGLKWNLPTGYIGAQYMQAQSGKCAMADGSACDASNSGAKVIGLGYYHTLSKQTMAYVMGQYNNNDDLNYYGVPGGVGVPTNLGANVYALTIGLKHSF